MKVDLGTGAYRVDIWMDGSSRQPMLTELMGGFGLGLRFLEKTPSTEEVLVFSTGFLTGDGTNDPVSAPRLFVCLRSPLKRKDGRGVMWSSVGGDFGLQLKRMGVDALVVGGEADLPVYLLIDCGVDGIAVEVKKADPGKTARDALACIHAEGYRHAAAVGPAAFKRVRLASIQFSATRSRFCQPTRVSR